MNIPPPGFTTQQAADGFARFRAKPPRYCFDLVRWNDQDVLEHLSFIGTHAEIPQGWAVAQRRPL